MSHTLESFLKISFEMNTHIFPGFNGICFGSKKGNQSMAASVDGGEVMEVQI